MKAISLWQPWATAIVCGAKKIETRSWSTKVIGKVAIHAAKKWNDECASAYGYLTDREKFCALLPRDDNYDLLPLPFGAIIGTAEIIACSPTETIIDKISPLEMALGNYSDGRFGWLLKNAVRFKEPIPYKGMQGFFNVEIPQSNGGAL